MKTMPFTAIVCSALLPLLLVVAGHSLANPKPKKDRKTICTNPHPEQLCSAANTCGLNGAACVLEVKRVGGGIEASVTPNIPNFPKDGALCINAGANVTWQGEGKHTGIMVDFGDSTPFDPSGPIMGGSDRPITVVAKKAGCYKYTVGACTPGSIYGMCGNSDLDLIVTGGAH
jgi:plastocyanin